MSGAIADDWELASPLLHLKGGILRLKNQPEALAACLEDQCRIARKAGQYTQAESALDQLRTLLAVSCQQMAEGFSRCVLAMFRDQAAEPFAFSRGIHGAQCATETESALI